MSLLIFDSHPLVVDKKLAKVIGLNQAMILQQVHYWLKINEQNKRNFHEGRYWTYNTIKEWQEEFPFWSKETVKRSFKKLRELEFIIVDNFNTYKMDRTLWYTINYDKLNEYIGSNSLNDNTENDPMEKGSLTQVLPETTTKTTTKTTTEIYNQSISQVKKDKKNKEKNKGQTDRRTDPLKYEYEKIIERCELFAIDENYRDAVEHAIKLLLLDIENKKRLKIGDNYYPIEMVKEDLKKIDFHIVQYAINKFKEASESYEIKNTIPYLKVCIYNAIHEMDIGVDSTLRSSGII